MLVRSSAPSPGRSAGLSLFMLVFVIFLGACEPQVVVERHERTFSMSPESCTIGLTDEALAGEPRCLSSAVQTLRALPVDAQAGCVYITLRDLIQSMPIFISEREDGTREFRNSEAFQWDLNDGPEASREVVVRWFFIDNATEESCESLDQTPTCEEIDGCYLALGPDTHDAEYLFDGRNTDGICQYTTRDGSGLNHPDVCDGRDNDCDGQIDNGDACMDNPTPQPEPDPGPDPDPEPMADMGCQDARDCSRNQPLCIEGICRECWPDLLECQYPRKPICTDAGVCRGCRDDAECGENRFCDLGSGACIECQVNADCPAERPQCQANGLCEGCDPLADNQCPAGESCLVDGTCGGCFGDASCPLNSPICNPNTNLCEGCVSDTDCSEGLRCYENLCRECITPGRAVGQCNEPNAPICDVADYRCRSCVTDDECGDDRSCYQGSCEVCSPTTNAGCADTGRICAPERFNCAACTQDEQCAQFYPDRPYCERESGMCSSCDPATNRGCFDVAPVCVSLPMGAICQPCVESDSCLGSEGTVCENGRCVACADDMDCGALVCATVGGRRTCTDCDPTRAPAENGCPAERPNCSDAGLCGECAVNDHCPTRTPICDDNLTCRACQLDAECALRGEVCASGNCVLCDDSRPSANDPNVDFGCTVEQPNCVLGGNRCTQ